MKATTEIIVRFADGDPMGHTNNAKYFTYMEQSRVALFKTLLNLPPDKPLKPEYFPFILAEISCRFLRPTYAENTLAVTAEVKEVKNSSFFIEYEIIDAKTRELVATGKSAQVWYDYQQGKSIPIPDAYRKILVG